MQDRDVSEQVFEGRRGSRPIAFRITLLPLVVGMIVGGAATFVLVPPARDAFVSVRTTCDREVSTVIRYRSAFPVERSPGEDPLLARAVYAPRNWPDPGTFSGDAPVTGPLLDEARRWLSAHRDATFAAVRRLAGDRESIVHLRDRYSTLAGGDVRSEIAIIDIDGSVLDASTRVRCEPKRISSVIEP